MSEGSMGAEIAEIQESDVSSLNSPTQNEKDSNSTDPIADYNKDAKEVFEDLVSGSNESDEQESVLDAQGGDTSPESPEVIPDEQASLEIPFDEKTLDLDTRYQRIIDALPSKAKSLDGLKDFLKTKSTEIDNKDRDRKFSKADRIRHKYLETLARHNGIENIDSFNNLVEYFETELTVEKSFYKTYKNRLPDEVRERVKANWEKKGWDAKYYNQGENDINFSRRKDADFNISSEHIPVLKALLQTGQDPVPVLQVLKQSGVRIGADFLEAYKLDSFYDTDTKGFIRLLWSPNLKSALGYLEKAGSQPHSEWRMYNSFDESVSRIDQIRQMAESGTLPDYPNEFYEQAGLIASATGNSLDLYNLDKYHDLLSNPGKIEFLTSAVANNYYQKISRTDLFEVLDSLQQDGLLEPLSVLMDSKVFTGELFGGTYSFQKRKDVTQEEVNQALKELVGDPNVQQLISNPDLQQFGRVASQINGGKQTHAEELISAFEKRQELVGIYDLVIKGHEDEIKLGYGEDLLEKAMQLVKNSEMAEMILSQEFQDFLKKIQSDSSFEVKGEDYFNKIATGVNDHRNFPIYEPVILAAYKIHEITDLLGDDITRDIIRGYRAEDRSDEYKRAEELWKKYKEFDILIPTYKLLVENGINIDKEKVELADWLSNIRVMPLLRSEYLNNISSENKQRWIESVIILPLKLQTAMIERDPDKDKLIIPDLDRIVTLADFISSSEFFKIEPESDLLAKEQIYSVIGSYKGEISELFKDGKPTRALADLLTKRKFVGALNLVFNEDLISSYESATQDFIKAWLELPYHVQSVSLENLDFPNISEQKVQNYKMMGAIYKYASISYLDTKLISELVDTDNPEEYLRDGVPSRKFVDALVRYSDYASLKSLLKPEVIDQYDGNEREVLDTWMSLPDDLKTEVVEAEPNFPNVPPERAEKYWVGARVIERIRNSPSAEIKKIESELVAELWKLEDPEKTLEEIIGVFERNNLPTVGKIYRVFEMIYDRPKKGQEDTLLSTHLASIGYLSPELKRASEKERRAIIYGDLLKVHIDSENPSLKRYLKVLKSGEQLIAKVDSEGIEDLSPSERNELGNFLDKMDMLYVNSLYGKRMQERARKKGKVEPNLPFNLSLDDRIKALRKNFRVRDDQALTDRVSEMFLKPVGIDRIDQALNRMSSHVERADARNKEYAVNGKIDVKAGDRFKGVDNVNLQKILQGGIVAREYLGVNAGSDGTPYDTDTSEILESDLENGMESAVENSMSRGYGDIFLLIRERGQFGPGRDKYELINSGSERHQGVRTGIASTEIDAVVDSRGVLQQDNAIFDNLAFAIAERGFYIPISDTEGKVLFTPEMYDQYRHIFDGVSEFGGSEQKVSRVGVDSEEYKFPNAPEVVSGTRSVLEQLKEDIRLNQEKIDDLSKRVRERIQQILAEEGVVLRNEFDTSIYGAELVDTGSTARGDSIPGESIDFDLSLQLDPNDSKRINEIVESIKQKLKLKEDKSHNEQEYVQIRAMGSEIIEGESLDIDIGVGKRADYGVFATSQALSEKLDSIRSTKGEDVHIEVLANIVLAKKVLKEGHAYKKGDYAEGGMGGVGVESWILQHDGNILKAFQSFWDTAHNEGKQLSYEEFAEKYKVFDAGVNIKSNKHDNFIRILKPKGYEAMLGVIGGYLGYQ